MDLRLALVLACFFLSGFAALLYQTAWTRELSFVFGTSEVAVAAVLAAYMGGLALGAAGAARAALRLRRPLLAYGVLELAIAVSALLVPWEIRGLNALYVGGLGGASEIASASAATTLFQLFAAFAVLLPPTAFMGATLPMLARHAVRREAEIGSRVGLLYAVNTAGAIAGTLVAAFLLMPEFGLRRTVWIGAGLNALVFALAALLSRRAPLAGAAEPAPADVAPGARLWILPAVAVSGAVSFAYEVLWTRLLGHLLGASLHAFATMLASFLLGIALGSSIAARFAATRARATLGFSLCQLGIALTSYAAFRLADRLPELASRLGAGPEAPLSSAGVAVVALLPITLFVGATFPFAVRVLARNAELASAATARVYAWNTVGAIAGSLGTGFVLLPGLGFEGTFTVGIGLNLGLAALAALVSHPRRRIAAGVAVAGGLALALLPPAVPWTLLLSSPMRTPRSGQGAVAYAAVGRTADVLLLDWTRRYFLTTNGLPEASIDALGVVPRVNVAHWLGALPAMVRPEAKRLLVVGLGGGTALELLPASYASVDVVEIEPEVLAANRHVAADRARDPLADPRVRVHIADARGALQLTDARFDGIVSQPSHPWTAGASHLYTREFFSLVRSRLEPGGVFVQWIGARFVDEALLRSLLATLLDVFDHVELFLPQPHGLLFVASDAPIEPLAGAARALDANPADLAQLGIHRLEDFAAAWALDEAGVRALAEGAPLNTDDHNRLAARSAQLGEDSLDRAGLHPLIAAEDPLLEERGLDRSALVRVLVAAGESQRALDVAMAGDGAREEAALGWVELGAKRAPRAARHFTRAIALDPDDTDAVDGLALTYRLALTRGEDVPAPLREGLSRPLAAVVAGWRLAETGDWEGVAALDDELAAVAPGDGLFDAAMRLRISQRLAANDATAAVEAEALSEMQLLRRWHPFDALLHARAAIAAGDPRAAIGSLERVASVPTKNEQGRTLALRALDIAKQLPESDTADLRARLARRAKRGPDES